MKRYFIFMFFPCALAALPGCQKLKGIFIKPPPGGVIQNSYPVKVYAYRSSVVVEATPQEFTEYFLDLSPLEDILGMIKMEFKNLGSGIDMTKAGTVLEVDVLAMGIKVRCNFITLKYVPDKEVWMMVQFDGSWILMRFELEPVKERTIISLNAISRPSENISAIIDTFNFLEIIASRIDMVMAGFQSAFDPSLDVKELTRRGLRGHVYEAFFQADEAAIWIDAAPEKVAGNILENLESYLPEMALKEGCDLKEFIDTQEGRLFRCPAGVEFLKINIDLETYFTWIKKDRKQVLGIYAAGREEFIFINLSAIPEAGGSRLNVAVLNELPGPDRQETADIMMALAAIPGRMSGALADIRSGVENAN